MGTFKKIIERSKETNIIEKTSSTVKLSKPVYYIESPNDKTVLVGIDVTIGRDKIAGREVFRISWYDTLHERIMTASEIRQKNDYFAFKQIDQEGGGFYYFTPMNLKIYNSKVKQRLVNSGDFTNNEDLTKAFLTTTEDEL